MIKAKQRIVEALAEMDGIELDGVCFASGFKTYPDETYGVVLTNYPTSHDAIQRIIDGLKEEESFKYLCHLCDICGVRLDINPELLFKATPRQKCKAVLKALGLWTSEMEEEG